VAIIGAGISGLCTCKSALECGMNPTVYEKGSMIGGGWTEEGFTPEELITNISRHNQTFSDYPWKPGSPDYPNRKEFCSYILEYAKTFKILPFVRLGSLVTNIKQTTTKKWMVEWIRNGLVDSATFDFVIVCSGFFAKAAIPHFPGLEKFKGTICHSKDFKKPDSYENKSVLVIGSAFSGCDIAESLARKTDKVFHMYRRPKWILPRYLKNPTTNRLVPADLVYYNRESNALSRNATREELNEKKNTWFKSICNQETISDDLAIVSPPTDPPFVTISDTYLDQIKQNRIHIKKGTIQKIDGENIYFQDNNVLKVDSIVFCTGYQTSLPFFDKSILNTLGYKSDDQLQPLLLYKTVLPPHSLYGLGFVGLYRGPFIGSVELQSRMVCMTFSKKILPPTDEEIVNGIQEELKIRNLHPRPQFPHGDFVGFCEDFAKHIGVLPNFDDLKNNDIQLYKKLWNGPFTAASYRLSGFGKNPKIALEIIDEINQAMNSPKSNL
jgi:dimethylaniline monooxygenase (N-oxide forming)